MNMLSGRILSHSFLFLLFLYLSRLLYIISQSIILCIITCIYAKRVIHSQPKIPVREFTFNTLLC